MLPSFRCFGLAACLLCVAACQRGPDTEGAEPAASTAASPPATASPAAAPPQAAPAMPAVAGASGTDYACADGTRLQAGFGEHDATLRWAGGRSLVLPRAESASKGGGDVYVGDTVSLQRAGTRLQLHDGGRAATDCAPATTANIGGGASDAAIADDYACDAGTRLSRNGDGSFRAEIPGNPPIRLTRIAGSEPPVFTGASLYLRIENDDGAILSQGDRTNELRCAAARAPA